jgi:hypothetical protein
VAGLADVASFTDGSVGLRAAVGLASSKNSVGLGWGARSAALFGNARQAITKARTTAIAAMNMALRNVRAVGVGNCSDNFSSNERTGRN